MGEIKFNSQANYILSILLIFFLFSCSDYTINLGNGYTYWHEAASYNEISHKHPAEGGRIPSNILSYSYDKNHIIAKQLPDSVSINIGYDREFQYDRGLNETYYWLIIKKEQRVLGPLDINEFNHKKVQYNVSDKLLLE